MMKKKVKSETATFTRRELDVMSILWRRGSGTVAEVREELVDDLAYTSVLWVLQTLAGKGAVRHEQEGRAYRYYPEVAPEQAGDSVLSRLMEKVYHGSAEMLLARLVAEQELSGPELRRMRTLLDERLEALGGEGSGGPEAFPDVEEGSRRVKVEEGKGRRGRHRGTRARMDQPDEEA
jgi:BlaI family transcriptional regulator, penicillinase repressor